MKKITLITLITLLTITLETECLDGSKCPNNKTCCLFEFGSACCPFENGVCCPDLRHCCPNGFSCNERGGCIPKNDTNIFNNNNINSNTNNNNNEKNKKKKKKFFSFNLPFDINWEKLKECLIKVKPEDEVIRKIIELIENKNYYEALKYIYEGIKKGSEEIINCLKE